VFSAIFLAALAKDAVDGNLVPASSSMQCEYVKRRAMFPYGNIDDVISKCQLPPIAEVIYSHDMSRLVDDSSTCNEIDAVVHGRDP